MHNTMIAWARLAYEAVCKARLYFHKALDHRHVLAAYIQDTALSSVIILAVKQAIPGRKGTDKCRYTEFSGSRIN